MYLQGPALWCKPAAPPGKRQCWGPQSVSLDSWLLHQAAPCGPGTCVSHALRKLVSHHSACSGSKCPDRSPHVPGTEAKMISESCTLSRQQEDPALLAGIYSKCDWDASHRFAAVGSRWRMHTRVFVAASSAGPKLCFRNPGKGEKLTCRPG